VIITVEDAKKYISTTDSDEVLESKLQALELLIRKYTNNNFQKRSIRTECAVLSQKLFTDYPLFSVGDTVQISQSTYNDGIYVIKEIADGFIELDANLLDEPRILITKVEYPHDVQIGAVNMLKWELQNRDKVGIQSEAISRHSVTYFNMDGDNSIMGFPKSLLGFLVPYKKARF
jgi:hypothetical protein